MSIQNSKFKIQKYNSKLKSKKTFAFLLSILTFAFCLLVLSGVEGLTYSLPTASAEGASLKMSPSTLQIRALAPADIRAPFTIVNQSNQTTELTIILKRFEASGGENGQIVYSKPGFTDERDNDPLLKNIQIVDNGFAVNSLTLSPKQEKKLELSIIMPKNAAPQDHYFSIIFLTKAYGVSQDTKETEKETISYIQAGINLPVLLSVGVNNEETAFIDEFSSPVFTQSGPVPFSLKIKNAGTHFISPKGVIIIKNMFGQVVGKVNIPSTNILSNTSRYITINNSRPTANSQQQTAKEILWPEKFLLGFYTATLTLASHDNELLYTRSIHFLAFPFSALITIIILIIAAFIIIKRLRKKLSEE